ncbi:anti-sigma factor [Isoptericola sp. b441]|uniref:Anti-sigma factor n=1 Tax=Actinotalea lenta TaxID=3064654 RepID=A0ABT9D808_9CELL|nr:MULTISPECIES: anti-sigma factor [unclassified Isoptericola]MDO8106253.1 anti-sigma factor [Isoptericola sp. b441]MDO8122027.1 anti-sigma factor [Isoptericola sp. b490]
MPHLEPDVIALAALGEPLDDDARSHLEQCAACRAELDALAVTAVRARAAGPVTEQLVEPPPAVWDRIAAELDLPEHVQPGPAPRDPGAHRVPQGAAAPTRPPAATGPAGRDARRRSRRRVAPAWLAAAAAVGVVLGGAGTAWWNGRSPTQVVVERATLDALPQWPEASGSAMVERSSDGTRRLVVTLSGAGADSGYHEVWLIDPEVTKLISLGVLHGDHGSFPLPDGVNLTQYPIVDVSEEPYDGNPAHSGDSIVRGVLGT